MDFLKNIKLIQGGMGVYVSNWRLAREVSNLRPGVTVGTVSGTALDVVYVRLLQLGDPGGHVRQALTAFDEQFNVDIGERICDHYYIKGGKIPSARFKYGPTQTAQARDGRRSFSITNKENDPVTLALDDALIEILIATAFAEVWLAKQGHKGKIFINFLKKVELPLMYSMYGAMLAGVDGIVVGAGNPDGLPAACSRLAEHAPVINELSVLYREAGETFILPFDPVSVSGGRLANNSLTRPAFLAIVSLENLVSSLGKSPSQPPDGFIIEHHTAGGHNAGPQGPIIKDELGQPIYSELDEPNIQAIREEGFPFWMAGGYGSQEKLQEALNAGANGVQVGTAFAMAIESGIDPIHRSALLQGIRNGKTDEELVRTSMHSPTGFPFKVAQVENTLADDSVYTARRRLCDLGFLQQRGLSKPDADGERRLFQRCSAAPVDDFINKRGLPINTEGKRCLCNALVAGVGLGQVDLQPSGEPAIVTLGNHLDGIRRLSRQGQSTYWAKDVVDDILGK